MAGSSSPPTIVKSCVIYIARPSYLDTGHVLALQLPAVVQNVFFISIYRVPRERIQGKCNGVGSLTNAAKSAIHLRIMCEESTIIKKEPQ